MGTSTGLLYQLKIELVGGPCWCAAREVAGIILHDEQTKGAVLDLLLGIFVLVGVIPIRTTGMIGIEIPSVGMTLSGWNDDSNIVRGASPLI